MPIGLSGGKSAIPRDAYESPAIKFLRSIPWPITRIEAKKSGVDNISERFQPEGQVYVGITIGSSKYADTRKALKVNTQI